MQYIQDKSAFYSYLYYNCHCVNAGQSKEERNMKYKLARYFGCNRSQAKRVMDWTKSHFAKRFGYMSWESMINIIGKEVIC